MEPCVAAAAQLLVARGGLEGDGGALGVGGAAAGGILSGGGVPRSGQRARVRRGRRSGQSVVAANGGLLRRAAGAAVFPLLQGCSSGLLPLRLLVASEESSALKRPLESVGAARALGNRPRG